MCARRCENTVRLLVEFIEGHLPPDVHAELEAHLARCSHCERQLKTYRSTISLLRGIKEDDLPPELRWTLRSFLDKNCHN